MKKRNTKAAEKVLNFLLDNPGEKFYLTQITRKLKISDSTVYDVLERQIKKGLIKKEKFGNLSLYFLDQTKAVSKQKKVLRTLYLLEPLIKNLKDWGEKVILFGSAAEGKDTAKSDIDLFVLSNDKNRVYKIFSQAKIKNKVKLIVKNFPEWVELRKKDNFFYNQINKGKVLWDKNESF